MILWYGVGGVECCCCCVRTEWWVPMLGWQKLQWKDQTSPYWRISYFSVLHLPGLCMWWSVSMYGSLPLPILCLWLAFMHVCVHVCMCACVFVFCVCITHQGNAQYFLWTSQACGLLGLVSWGKQRVARELNWLHKLNWWWLYMKVVVCMHECIFWSRTLWGNQKCKVVRRIFGGLLWGIQNWLEKWLQVAIKKKSSWVWVSARKSRIREGWGCNSGFCATCRPVARAQQAGCHKSSLVQRPGMYATLMTSQLWSGWPSHPNTTTHTCPVSLALFLSFSLSLILLDHFVHALHLCLLLFKWYKSCKEDWSFDLLVQMLYSREIGPLSNGSVIYRRMRKDSSYTTVQATGRALGTRNTLLPPLFVMIVKSGISHYIQSVSLHQRTFFLELIACLFTELGLCSMLILVNHVANRWYAWVEQDNRNFSSVVRHHISRTVFSN